MAVNLSVRQLLVPDIAEAIAAVLARTGVRPSDVCIELTESAIHLDCPIPYVEILPEGRQLKTEDSKR